uniref:Uncharacterized protein n=1 Tax=Opuntia streptacantha TaxID=393608 RepID=A0A7C8YS32_OPUST
MKPKNSKYIKGRKANAKLSTIELKLLRFLFSTSLSTPTYTQIFNSNQFPTPYKFRRVAKPSLSPSTCKRLGLGERCRDVLLKIRVIYGTFATHHLLLLFLVNFESLHFTSMVSENRGVIFFWIFKFGR